MTTSVSSLPKPLSFQQELPSTEGNSIKVTPRVKGGFEASWVEGVPESTRARFEKYGIDYKKGYPEQPPTDLIPTFLDEAYKIREDDFPYVERGKGADPEKKALFGAAKEVRNLTKYIGTEIVGLQLNDLNDKQKDELALLVAERGVVFFRNQSLSPQKQLELGHYWGQVEVHPQVSHVTGHPGLTVIWPEHRQRILGKQAFSIKGIHSGWHQDLVHEHQPSGITHLHLDSIPSVGGDTSWSSTYGAYDKLSPAFQKFLDGKNAIQRSAHLYLDRNDPLAGPKYIEREHPLVRTHPATGWKFLFVNRGHTTKIVGLEPAESEAILSYLFKVVENNLDIQVRFQWQPNDKGLGASAIWDNRTTNHNPVWSSILDNPEPRHGTRVTSLAEVPFFDPSSKSQREALGLS